MTNIFETFKTQSADKLTIAAFQDLCLRQGQIPTTITINISIYGQFQSGKTTLALLLSQCPKITIQESTKTAIINSLLVPVRARPAKLTIMDLHHSSQFVLTDFLFIVIDVTNEDSVYIEDVLSQAFPHQFVVVFLTKVDKIEQCQTSRILQLVEKLKSILSHNRHYILPINLLNDDTRIQLNSILFETYQYARFLQAQRALQDSEKELKLANLANEKLVQERFNTVFSQIPCNIQSEQQLVEISSPEQIDQEPQEIVQIVETQSQEYHQSNLEVENEIVTELCEQAEEIEENYAQQSEYEQEDESNVKEEEKIEEDKSVVEYSDPRNVQPVQRKNNNKQNKNKRRH